MPLSSLNLLPPAVTKEEALDLLKQAAGAAARLAELNAEFKHCAAAPSLFKLFVLSESVHSARIEGSQVTFSGMLEPGDPQDRQRREVMNCAAALQRGAELIRDGLPFSSRLICEIHRTLMPDTRGAADGDYRTGQSFIGPDADIKHAVYLPVPADKIPKYLTNLEHYLNGTAQLPGRLPEDKELYVLDAGSLPLFKTAIMHAQFESIHPFADGNGRTGRILIPLMAVKYGQLSAPILLLSEALAQRRFAYYRALNLTRGAKPQWSDWLHLFMSCAEQTARRLINQLERAARLYAEGLVSCRRESERRIWQAAFNLPLLTCTQAAQDAGLSIAAARYALKALTDRKLLSADSLTAPPRIYFNGQLCNILLGVPE